MMKRYLSVAALAATVFAPQAAHADNWGCEVLLCLANPAGPMAVSQCVPPITRLYRAIFKWRPDPFPTCLMSNGLDSSSGGNYARVGPPSYYDACPVGTTALPAGVVGALGVYSERTRSWPYRAGYEMSGSVANGIGDGSGYSPSYDSEMPTKTCVGARVGSTSYGFSWDDTVTVQLYDRVVSIPAAPSTFNINVYVNNRLHTNVRPGF